LQLAPGDSIVSAVVPKGRHTRSTPQIPLVTPEDDTERIIKKGKDSQEIFPFVLSGTSGHFPNSFINTPVVISSIPPLPSAEISKNLDFENFPLEYSSFDVELKEKKIEILASPDIVKWFRLESLEDFPTLVFATPPPIKFFVTKEEETSYPLQPIPYSSKTHPFSMKTEIHPSYIPFSPKLHTIKYPSLPCSPTVQNPMIGANAPRNRMDAIVVSRYAPLILPHPMNSLPTGDYLKYMPKLTGEEDITVEEHLVAFYSYGNNLNIENEDVWIRVFFQILDGEAGKWFRGLTPGSITGIEALDDAFLRQWGDKKDFLYYIIEFGSLKRKEGEFVSDFSRRFKKMYNNIPTKIKPTKTSAKITYSSDFDPDFCLLLRERRSASLAHMKDSSLAGRI
jgi:hypothetical protein